MNGMRAAGKFPLKVPAGADLEFAAALTCRASPYPRHPRPRRATLPKSGLSSKARQRDLSRWARCARALRRRELKQRSNYNQREITGGPTQIKQLITGAGSPNRTDQKFGISGTDLGIAYSDDTGHSYYVFGDSMDCVGEGDGWRSNLLLRTTDHDYGDGLRLEEALTTGGWSDNGRAKEFIPSQKVGDADTNGERTTIPTAGIVVDGVHYVDYMSVRSWHDPNTGWSTNYAATVKSTDGGVTWRAVPEATRTNASHGANAPIPGGANYRAGFEKLQQSAYIEHGDYVYRFTTGNGRRGPAYLSRAPKSEFPNERAFSYYSDGSWVKDPAQASEVLDGKVSELSVAYNQYLGKFVTMYGVEGEGIVMRTADSPEGPWSPRRMLVSAETTKVVSGEPLNDTYAPFVLPNQDDQHLYYTLTSWRDYNTMLMRTDLDFVGEDMENNDHIAVSDVVATR
ncbi:DUF4185 domain-containing protein [Corynebacterium sp. Marseille-Q2823]|uniref:DUF4185 domain-containing protein n=1 Tax=Corynebacterium sp. Marseille-Q2823 TaxID=2736606 RepID=UPI0020CA5223|nr:DUF4185 domain-containing protein [Corynebacterium sp. Marseille-Q2823]